MQKKLFSLSFWPIILSLMSFLRLKYVLVTYSTLLLHQPLPLIKTTSKFIVKAVPLVPPRSLNRKNLRLNPATLSCSCTSEDFKVCFCCSPHKRKPNEFCCIQLSLQTGNSWTSSTDFGIPNGIFLGKKVFAYDAEGEVDLSTEFIQPGIVTLPAPPAINDFLEVHWRESENDTCPLLGIMV